MIRKLILIISLIFLTTASANSLVIFNDPIEYSQCTNINGTSVHTTYTYTTITSSVDYARAGKDKKKAPTKYYIYMDYETFHNAPLEVREWVWYHECGHHRLGHTLDFSRYAESTSSIISSEKEADCFAAREFRKYHQESELHLALKWLNESEVGISTLRSKRIKECK